MPIHFDSDDYETDLQAVADGLFAVAAAIKLLGNADAATSMGGLEALGEVVREGFESLAISVSGVGSSLDVIGPIIIETRQG
jgi:hypothetical protein